MRECWYALVLIKRREAHNFQYPLNMLPTSAKRIEVRMTIKLAASALALTAIVALPQWAGTVHAFEMRATQYQHTSKINIARIKRVLKLTAAQERYWPPVEAALIKISRRQARHDADGVTMRVSRRAVAVVFDSAAIAQLAAAARPLVRVLDDEQTQAALKLAQEMGLAGCLPA